jgi:NAD(P)-dependent dehydrogenase (short-subunit alcohol dehydrogenase family)
MSAVVDHRYVIGSRPPGTTGLAGHCATGRSVRLFDKTAAMECAAVDDRIRVNTVHPGVIDTPMDEPTDIRRTRRAD